MEIEFPKPTDVLGRIAAQTAKQVIFQKVREAERENIFAEYNQRIGEVVNATAKRFENGDMVTDGRITRSGDSQARLLRDNVVVHEGKISSLRRFKDDVSEVKAGFECGIAFDRYNDLKIGDVIEVFVIERVATPA